MEIPPYPAIMAFCRIIGELPQKARSTAIGFTCSALGQHAQPTGLEFSPDRPIGHLYWDREMADLYNRLVYLVETVGLREQLVVQGVASFIQTHFALWADEDSSNASTAGFRNTIEKVEQQMALPIERRDGRQSDDALHEFRKNLDELIETADARRQDAEDTRQCLESQCISTFTLEFWEALNRLWIERSRPDVDELLGNDEE